MEWGKIHIQEIFFCIYIKSFFTLVFALETIENYINL